MQLLTELPVAGCYRGTVAHYGNSPIFTGYCPSCGYQFPSHVPELVHFDCIRCGWIDDSV